MTKAQLRARLDRATELLQSVQFVQPSYNGRPTCSCCEFYGEKDYMHAEGCELADFLNSARREPVSTALDAERARADGLEKALRLLLGAKWAVSPDWGPEAWEAATETASRALETFGRKV